MIKYVMIPANERLRYSCIRCGETRSVKYLVTNKTAKGEYKSPYCNRCFLFVIQRRREPEEIF